MVGYETRTVSQNGLQWDWSFLEGMATTQDKHYLYCQRVSLAQGVDWEWAVRYTVVVAGFIQCYLKQGNFYVDYSIE